MFYVKTFQYKKAFQWDVYRRRSNKDEQWTSSHEADCEQTDTNEKISFPLQSVIRISVTVCRISDN